MNRDAFLQSTEDSEQVMLLQFSKSMEIEEHFFDKREAEWMLLAKTLGWKAGLHKLERMKQQRIMDMDAVTQLNKPCW